MKQLGSLLALVVLGSAPGRGEGEELKRASLAGVSRIGAVIVTVANGTVSEDEVRHAVERRLAQAKISVDNAPGPELLVSVSAERSKAETGSCQCGTFRVIVSLREVVTLERAPEQGPVAAITWRTGGAIKRFSITSPRLGIMDTIEDGLSSFVGSIASDSQQAAHERDEP